MNRKTEERAHEEGAAKPRFVTRGSGDARDELPPPTPTLTLTLEEQMACFSAAAGEQKLKELSFRYNVFPRGKNEEGVTQVTLFRRVTDAEGNLSDETVGFVVDLPETLDVPAVPHLPHGAPD